ncbi:Heat shock protein, Metallo peptidase, MEROPS family M48B [Cytophaga hutchinsonii ATCC 33406]|uniref:Heat shock protein, Metallo peptidase, MEROPS family M48B n=2 Tax=Cytophaga hutchinsonii TaxID=985 RepID=A0A6N4SWP1_CYTH3|nr:Heat shock protein, Metallo peptidase, MEROPS family M48B [Cytophaga hutchinsonii ATCC 33406]SFX71389.1 Heat shock protein. Metallo peptidase. MEROPS family M48B [Cytophaga hutchinsonii ATCC 33406]
MKYIGIQKQIRRNNRKTLLLLFLFPMILIVLSVIILGSLELSFLFLCLSAVWFVIAYFFHNKMIEGATASYTMPRKENTRVYNLLENMCISQGMQMPQLNIIDDDSLNAFASGINQKTFTITLSKGIIEKLNDEELEGVIAHELSHIINRDVRLLIISIVFVGIFSFISEMALRGRFFAGRRDNDGKSNLPVILLVILASVVAFLIARLLHFAISRKREYLADAGAAEITKKPYALASALRKISEDPYIESVTRRDVAQLFMHNPQFRERNIFGSLFSTHPPIEKRIALLEQFV